MSRFSAFLLLLLASIGLATSSSAQRREPLQFLPPESILLLHPTEGNALHIALAADPSLTPQAHHIDPKSTKPLLQLHHQGHLPQQLDSLASLLALTADARYAHAIDSIKHHLIDSLQAQPTATSLAAPLLSTIGMIAATDTEGIYLNLLDDCMIIAKTPHFALTLDQIEEYEGHKYRISALPPQQKKPIALRLRLPHPTRRATFYLNGKRLLSPQYEGGYLVVKRQWRNGDELFYRFP